MFCVALNQGEHAFDGDPWVVRFENQVAVLRGLDSTEGATRGVTNPPVFVREQWKLVEDEDRAWAL